MYNKYIEEQNQQGIQREIDERINSTKVNEVCHKEWEMRLKAQEHLENIQKKSKMLEGLIINRKMSNPNATMNNNFSRIGIYNPAYLVKNNEREDRNHSGAVEKKLTVYERL